MTVSREQVITRLREAGFSFKKQAKRVDLYRQHGSGERVFLARNARLEERYVRIVLQQAGLTRPEIEEFFANCVSGD